MGMIGSGLPPCSRNTPMSGLMVALSLIRSLVFLLLGLGSLLNQSSEDCWRGNRWCHIDRVRLDGLVHSCRGFCSVPGPLQSVQLAEM